VTTAEGDALLVGAAPAGAGDGVGLAPPDWSGPAPSAGDSTGCAVFFAPELPPFGQGKLPRHRK